MADQERRQGEENIGPISFIRIHIDLNITSSNYEDLEFMGPIANGSRSIGRSYLGLTFPYL